jgi:hypothetical protein
MILSKRSTKRRPSGLLVIAIAAVLVAVTSCQTVVIVPPAPTGVHRSTDVAAFADRVAISRPQLPYIAKAAEAAAQQAADYPNSLINAPYSGQDAFAEEMMNRAGGLANIMPHIERSGQVTPDDVAVFAIRSWEESGTKMIPMMRDYKGRGWIVTLFASKAGAPDDLDVDWFIDNGASSGSADEGAVNVIANALNGWLWVCEYSAALTRHGRYPGILRSVLAEGHQKHNYKLQAGNRRFLGDTDQTIAAETLGQQYFERVDRLLADIVNDKSLAEIDAAAKVVADHINAGGTLKVATCLHILMSEIFTKTKAPFQPFNAIWGGAQEFDDNLHDGDLLVYFAYVGMQTPYRQYGDYIAGTGTPVVTCYVTCDNPLWNKPVGLAHIEQHWHIPDAEIAVPFPPAFVAPVSGIDQALLFRMLDRAIAAKLTAGK